MKFRLPSHNFGHQKMAIMLNVLCLSVAFSVLFIVVRQVRYDFRYDSCYPEVENIYKLNYYNLVNGKHEGLISMPVIHEAIGSLPEVESYTILWCDIESATIYCLDKEYEVPFYNVYPGFFKVFQPRILAGDAEEAIKNGSGLVIPQSLAQRWFGRENPINQSISLGNKNNSCLVKAVYEDFPENSSLENGILARLEDNKDRSEWSYHCFFRLVEGIDGKEAEQKIIQYTDSVFLAVTNGKERYSDIRRYELLPMKDIYFYPGIEVVKDTGHGNRAITLTLLSIGILIILIAYTNFINFSTALAPARIGTFNVLKINGASTIHLMRIVITEAVGLSLLGWLLSLLWIYGFSETALAKAYFSASLSPWKNWDFSLVLGVTAVLLGMLAGLYPAYYMSSFQPALVLKGSFALSASGRRLRNGLLTFQFVVAMVLIIGAWFVVIQKDYMRNLPWGYEKENIVYVHINEQVGKNLQSCRADLMSHPDILGVTASRYLPGSSFMQWGRKFKEQYISFYAWPVEPDFLDFFGIPVIEGEELRTPPAGKDYVIFNRKMLEKYPLENILGEEFGAFDNKGTVIGIAENVNFASMHHHIEPMAFVCGDDMWNNYVFVKITPQRIPETVAYIKKYFEKAGVQDCEVTFLESFIDRLYQREENLSWLISLFCLITVIISLAGIYGLILFNIRYKVKEVGIRKIHYATVGQMLWMLNCIFLRLVIIGFIIAAPLGYLLVDWWLDSYPYRTPIHGWVFLLALLLTLLITMATVWHQSVKAATANPVDAVKTE